MAYELELREGSLRSSQGNVKVMIVPVAMVHKLNKEFAKIVGPASKIIVRNVGKSLGEAMADMLELKDANDLNELANAISEFMLRAGFGKTQVAIDGNTLLFKVLDAPTVKEESACHFEEGVIKGLLETITNCKWKTNGKTDGESCVISAKRL